MKAYNISTEKHIGIDKADKANSIDFKHLVEVLARGGQWSGPPVDNPDQSCPNKLRPV